MILHRREFLGLVGAGIAFSETTSSRKPLRGIFPIAQTPFTGSGQLDLDVLAAEVRFVHRCGAHGFVWPQIASEYSTLTESERLAGTEAILAAGKNLRPAIVIGAQAPNVDTARRYARQAERFGADAVIALPPAGEPAPDALLDYYKAIGTATVLPLFVQAIGNLPVASILHMAKEIPTLGYVKDEAGASPLPRIGPLREKVRVFTGAHGVTLIDELIRGSSGSMPATSYADLYAKAWDLWQAGQRRHAIDFCARALLFVPEAQVYGVQALKYVLHLRGVFPNWSTRVQDAKAPLDDAGKRTLQEMFESLQPYLQS